MSSIAASTARPTGVLHVVDSLERGGLERTVADLAVAQRDAGAQVGVFSLLQTGGLRGELERAGIPVRIGAKNGTFDLAVLASIRRAVRELGIGVVHAHGYVPNYYAAVATLGMPGGPALVCTCHDMGDRLRNGKLRAMFRASLLRTARIAMVGRGVRDRFVERGWVPAHRARIVLNAIPTERFAPDPERRARARASLGMPADALVIGCVGRLVALKNHATMIDAMGRLRERAPAARLVLIGGGPEEAALRARVDALGLGEHVVLTGERDDVASLMQALDLFVLPSLTEGLSIALLEAQAAGLPSVAGRVGGNVELLEHGRTGLLVDPTDLDALVEAVAGLLADDALRARLGRSARDWVRDNASLSGMVAAYQALYREAAGRG